MATLSSASVTTILDLLECTICLETLKQPRVLPGCQHTFCQACLASVAVDNGKLIICPICRKEYRMANALGGIESFPRNILVQQLLDLNQTQLTAQTAATGSSLNSASSSCDFSNPFEFLSTFASQKSETQRDESNIEINQNLVQELKPLVSIRSDDSPQIIKNTAVSRSHNYKWKMTVAAHTGSVKTMAMSNESTSRQFVTTSDYGCIKVWHVDTGECWQTIECAASSLAIGNDARQLISGCVDGMIRIWNLETGECVKKFKAHSGAVCCVLAHSDGQLISGSSDDTIKVWNLSKLSQRRLDGRTDGVVSMVMSQEGQLITGHLKSIKVWDVSSGEMAKKLQGHKNKVLCLAMSLSGRLISGSRDNTIKFWNIERGECLQTLTGHRIYSVNALAVGCFNGLMASGSGDNTIKIWDVETGECLQTLTGHTRPVSVLAMAKKGQLVSGSADETLRIWNYEFNGSRC